MTRLLLGDLQLDGFEVPATLNFGGEQRATVHRLLGGGRVIDAMGRDDRPITWRGILTGPGASGRALALDATRAAGQPLALSWEVFSYEVVISSLHLEFQSPWWIRYEIACTVLADLSAPIVFYETSVADAVLADLNAADTLVSLGSLVSQASGAAALERGSAAVPGIIAGARAATAVARSQLTAAEAGLESNDITVLVSASGTMAQLSTAQGYLQRSIDNLQDID